MPVIKQFQEENDPRNNFRNFATEDADLTPVTDSGGGMPVEQNVQPIAPPPEQVVPEGEIQPEQVRVPAIPVDNPETGLPAEFANVGLAPTIEQPDVNQHLQLYQNQEPVGDVTNLPNVFPTPKELGIQNDAEYQSIINQQLQSLEGIGQLNGTELPNFYDVTSPDRLAAISDLADRRLLEASRFHDQQVFEQARANQMVSETVPSLNPTNDPSKPSLDSSRQFLEGSGAILFNEQREFDFKTSPFSKKVRSFGDLARNFRQGLVQTLVGNSPMGDYPGGVLGVAAYIANTPSSMLWGGLNDLSDLITGNRNPNEGHLPRWVQALTRAQDYSPTSVRSREVPLGLVSPRNETPETWEELRQSSWYYNIPLVNLRTRANEWFSDRFFNTEDEKGQIPGAANRRRILEEEDGRFVDLSILTEFAENLSVGDFNVSPVRPIVFKGIQGALNLALDNPTRTGEFLVGLGLEAITDPLDVLPRAVTHLNGRILNRANDIPAAAPEIKYAPNTPDPTMRPRFDQNASVTGEGTPPTLVPDQTYTPGASELDPNLYNNTTPRNAIPALPEEPFVRPTMDGERQIPTLQAQRQLEPDEVLEQTQNALRHPEASVGQQEDIIGAYIEHNLEPYIPPSTVQQALPPAPTPDLPSVRGYIESLTGDSYTDGYRILGRNPGETSIVDVPRKTNSEIAAEMGLNRSDLSNRRLQIMQEDFQGINPMLHYGDQDMKHVDDFFTSPDVESRVQRRLEQQLDEAQVVTEEATQMRNITEETIRLNEMDDALQRQRRARRIAAGEDIAPISPAEARVMDEIMDFIVDHPNHSDTIVEYQLTKLPQSMWVRSPEGIEETARLFRQEQLGESLSFEIAGLQKLYRIQGQELVNNLDRVDDLPNIGRKPLDGDLPFTRKLNFANLGGSGEGLSFRNEGYVRPVIEHFDSKSMFRSAEEIDLANEINQLTLYHGTRVDLPQAIDEIDPIQGASRSEIGTVIHTSNDPVVGSIYANAPSNADLPPYSVRTSVYDFEGADRGAAFRNDGTELVAPSTERVRRTFNEHGQVYEIQPQVMKPLDSSKPIGIRIAQSLQREVTSIFGINSINSGLDTSILKRLKNAFNPERSLSDIFERVDNILAEEFREFPEDLATNLQRMTSATVRDIGGYDAIVTKKGDYYHVGLTGIPGRQRLNQIQRGDSILNAEDVPIHRLPRDAYFKASGDSLTASLYPNSTFSKVNAAESLTTYQSRVAQITAQRLENANKIGKVVGDDIAQREGAIRRMAQDEYTEITQRKLEKWENKNQRQFQSYNSPEEGLC
jgi:hypothetical protein